MGWAWRRFAAPAAAAIAVISFGAGAAALVGRYVHAPVEAVEPPAAIRSARPAGRIGTPAPASPEELMELPAPVPMAPPAPSLEPAAPIRRHRHRHVRAPAAEVPKSAAPVSAEIDLETAPLEDLLALANERRRDHLWVEADELYQAVVQRFPSSDAAVVAEVASAALHVDKLRDPAGALAAYQRTLSARPTGPLAEESRWGLVEAWRALGDGVRESAALTEFLAHHPGSALAPAARRRQGELMR